MTDDPTVAPGASAEHTARSSLEPWVREILACPACRSPLRDDLDTGELVCTNDACGLAYPIVDGIPVLLIDDARATRSGAAMDAPESPTP